MSPTFLELPNFFNFVEFFIFLNFLEIFERFLVSSTSLIFNFFNFPELSFSLFAFYKFFLHCAKLFLAFQKFIENPIILYPPVWLTRRDIKIKKFLCPVHIDFSLILSQSQNIMANEISQSISKTEQCSFRRK